MSPINIHALHGFLGSPQDWEAILGSSGSLFHHNLFDPDFSAPKEGFFSWAKGFNAAVSKRSSALIPNIVIGYSLGGRLALHALLENPKLWSAAVIISTHTGLQSPAEKEKRALHDLNWAQRFEKDDWKKLMQDWNGQGAFIGSKPLPERKETEYCRRSLSEALVGWSLANQADLSSSIKKLSLPILWITGELDHKYCDLADPLSFQNPISAKKVVPDAGHRVPWDQPKAFRLLLNQFFNTIASHHKERL